MNLRFSIFDLRLASALCLLLCFGCAASPTARWAQARDSLSLAERTVLRAHAGGRIGDDDLVALDEFVQGARAALAQAEQRLPWGSGQFDFYMDLAEGVLAKLTDPAFTALAGGDPPLTPVKGGESWK